MKNPVKTLLQDALAYFEEHGGAVGQYFEEDGTVCAIGALNMVFTRDASQDSRCTTYRRAAELLDDAATYMGREYLPSRDRTPVTVINDVLGVEAARQCYRNAIAGEFLEAAPRQ